MGDMDGRSADRCRIDDLSKGHETRASSPRPLLRTWTKIGTWRLAANLKSSITSPRVEPGEYSSPMPTPSAPASISVPSGTEERASRSGEAASSVAGPD